MNTQERQSLLDQFHASHQRLLALVAGLSPAQWSFHPAPERWSIADCLEHVTAVEERVLGLIHKQLEGPGDPERRALTEGKEDVIRRSMPNRSNKIVAPEPVRPSGRWPEPAELVARYTATRERTVAFVKETTADLRGRGWSHIAFGELDCYQWLVAISHHGDRHAAQMEEVTREPAYPLA